MARRALIAGLLIPFVLLGAAAHADDSEVETLRAQLKSTVLQLRQLQDQQAQAAAPAPSAGSSDSALKAKLAAAEAQLRAVRAKAADASGAQAALAKAQAENAALNTAVAANAAELQKAKAAYEQADAASRAATTERDQLKAKLTDMTNIATACQAKNERLVTFSEGLLRAYRKVSFGDAMMASEPFLQLKRVQLENIEQDREDTVLAARCDARIDVKGPAPAPPAAPRG